MAETKYDKNQTHYVSATVIVVNPENKKFLIAKRAGWEKAFPNKWTVPGGKLEVLDYIMKEKDTSVHWYNILESLAQRECLEEVGLELKPESFGYVTSLVYIRPDKIPSLIISLYAEPTTYNINLCKALTEYAWVSLEELKQNKEKYDLIEGIYEELEILDNILKKGEKQKWEKLKT